MIAGRSVDLTDKRRAFTGDGKGLPVEMSAAIGTIFRPAATTEEKEKAWAHIKQTFLNPKPNSMEPAHGADAVKELVLFGDNETMERAVGLLAEGIRTREWSEGCYAIQVSRDVLESADLTVRSYHPDPFKKVLGMLEDTLMHGAGSITDHEANRSARQNAQYAVSAALSLNDTDYDRAGEIMKVLKTAAVHGDSGTRALAIETLKDGQAHSSGRMQKCYEEALQEARAELIRSFDSIQPRV